MSELEEITREEHDKLFLELFNNLSQEINMMLVYYNNLARDEKKFNIKYLYERDTGNIIYKKVGEKEIGYKRKGKTT